MIYDPVADKWTDITPPRKLLPFIGGLSRRTCCPTGASSSARNSRKRFSRSTPKTLTWSELPSKHKHDFNAEEGWVLLPDGSILTFDVKAHPQSERYLPERGQWVDAGSTVVDLRAPQDCCGTCIQYGPKNKCYDPPGEIGRLRPAAGRHGVRGRLAARRREYRAHLDLHAAQQGRHEGPLDSGPGFPDWRRISSICRSPSCRTATCLCEGSSGRLYEFDGKNLISQNAQFARRHADESAEGEVLIGGFAGLSANRQRTTHPGRRRSPTPLRPSRAARRTRFPARSLTGSRKAPRWATSSIRTPTIPLLASPTMQTGHVFYARTHDHSTMGVQTGSAPVSTNFDVPAGMETGASKLEVVANGIPSKPVDVTVN